MTGFRVHHGCVPPGAQELGFSCIGPSFLYVLSFALPLCLFACLSTSNGYTCSPCFDLNRGAKWRECQSALTSVAVNHQEPLRVSVDRVYFIQLCDYTLTCTVSICQPHFDFSGQAIQTYLRGVTYLLFYKPFSLLNLMLCLYRLLAPL